jgi:ribonucleoside-diphosphate reductase beta chain
MSENKVKHSAVNWNEDKDGFTQVFWRQFVLQFWIDTEVGVGRDKKHWELMSTDEKDALKKALAGLTLLDTKQSTVGMPVIAENVDDLQRKAVLSFGAMMEAIHAKSYSTIFTTLMETFEINELFNWVEEQPHLQYKAQRIVEYYENAGNNKKDLYKAMVASVYLESFLFYSGFFYPLYLAGHGRMMATADIINLILRDESIHGVYVGLLAQELYNEFNEDEKQEVDKEMNQLLQDLMNNEIAYTHEIYGKIDLAGEVIEFLKYNANKAFMNLGKEPLYENVKINPIVETGLDTETKTHDFFSVKGNGYIKAQIEPLTDEDFNW